MTIIEALRADKIERIDCDNRWLVWLGENSTWADRQFCFAVLQAKNRVEGEIILYTESEEEAVRVLIGEEL